jgi:hypothetical protein
MPRDRVPLAHKCLDLDADARADYMLTGQAGERVRALGKCLSPRYDDRRAVSFVLGVPATAPVVVITLDRERVDKHGGRGVATERTDDHVHQRPANGKRRCAVNRSPLSPSDEISERAREWRLVALRVAID